MLNGTGPRPGQGAGEQGRGAPTQGELSRVMPGAEGSEDTAMPVAEGSEDTALDRGTVAGGDPTKLIFSEPALAKAN